MATEVSPNAQEDGAMPEAPTSQHAGRGSGRPRGLASRRRSLVFAGLGVGLAAALALVLFAGIGTGQSGPSAPSGQVAPGIDVPSAKLLDLNVLPSPGAPTTDFALTDQHGRSVSLAQFRGKSVVLSFNDDQCPDLCTLLAQDIVIANRDLGPAAGDVVFLSVNVNPYYPQVSAVRSWTDQHGLGNAANWVFTTGSPTQLKKVWHQYGVSVQLDATTRTVVHGTELFFIDPAGRERAIGAFGTNAANTTLFAHVMAQMAADLLPPSQRGAVGGPATPAPTVTNATVGARGPSFSLPVLGQPSRRLASSDLAGRYTVLNFWASTCSACVGEMPHVEQVYRELGSHVNVVGVDVSDDAGAASAFVQRVGATYPIVADAAGSTAGAYRITGLPFTVILGPLGTVLVRHPGAMTAEQLRYVVVNLDPALGSKG